MLVPSPISLDRDIRHLGPENELSSDSITGVTRQLSARDNTLGDAINGVIKYLINTTQIVALPILRLSIPGLSSLPVANFRVPAGYVASVLNVSVASNPAGQATLEIVYSPDSFGQDGTGQNNLVLVTTAAEVTGPLQAVNVGELIIKVANNATSSVEVIASVMLSIAPTV